jgi:propanediol dehydratase small subunit
LAAQKPDGFVAADVYRKRIAANAEQARELLVKIEKEGFLQCQRIPRPGGKGGWFSEKYFPANL